MGQRQHDHAHGETVNPVAVINPTGASRIVFVCEHASNAIPETYRGLGLSETDKTSHAAYDPGALGVLNSLVREFDAVGVYGTVSRLVYDCNRPPEAPSAMPAKSEKIVIPANETLSQDERDARTSAVYIPFRDTLSDAIAQKGEQGIVVTVHSFTPTYFDQPRRVEIGVIHDKDAQLAREFVKTLQNDGTYISELNEPYSRDDGVAHTLNLHGTQNGLQNAMIEVRNDLITNDADQEKMGAYLAQHLRETFATLGIDLNEATA
ncbi:N-formylglutamate amidohydrolase [Amylibacter ulvae]|uniref:N-formylglutamate amidohydrolase n=1 Tax=Paramylibacter ulvae TaxID=1651968 RepID=A0ABQ3CSW0_9RHOB|nr:N-formylglutamate amidohydrolase [Amylibacter ulvae]GHA41835.1 N-formylglutamate amidohydrolase [Amylibacter ulvae]